MNTKDIIETYEKFVMNTYNRVPVALESGRGIVVKDAEGKSYLDFFPGWAVSGLGHCHLRVTTAIKSQLNRIMHISNNYYNRLQAALAERIIENSFEGKVFFANSGAEANEAAIKLARKYGNPNRYEIIAMENSFHGRTLATITATGQSDYQIGFEPLVEGFKHVPFNDISALKDAITEKTIAILIEPIQGEGGINIAGISYIKEIREICNQKNILLIFDEVQTGIGRTGKMFCYEHYGIFPDIMTLAKSLGSGIPIGAMVAKKEFADVLKPGTHASTFGGSPIACVASLATFEAIEKEKLLKNAEDMGKYLKDKLGKLKQNYKIIKEIRGIGLMLGVELNIEGAGIINECIESGLLINCTHKKVLRIMPPLTVIKKDIDKAINILDKALKKYEPRPS